jgi:hypothetical protein
MAILALLEIVRYLTGGLRRIEVDFKMKVIVRMFLCTVAVL